MEDSVSRQEAIKRIWHMYLTTGNMPRSLNVAWFEHKSVRPFVRWLPSPPRCRICYIPFRGIGGYISRNFWGVVPSKLHPHMCNLCEDFATEYHGGAELEMAIMFVDVRGSTTMAEKMSPEEFSKKINRFYNAVTQAFYAHYGLVEKFQGDAVAGFFVPGFAGPNFSSSAVKAGRQALQSLGYGNSSKPWIDAGVGIHTGMTYVGSVSTNSGVSDIAMLGDSVNITARLASEAKPGEILISEDTRKAAGLSETEMESRTFCLKGKTTEVAAWSIKIQFLFLSFIF